MTTRGPFQPRLLAPPGLGELPGLAVSGGGERVQERAEQALVLVAAAIADLDAVGLEAGHQAGVEQRRLPHPRGAVEQQDGRPAGLLHLLEELADLVAAAEEDLGVGRREPAQAAERVVGEVPLGERREAEEGIAGRVGQAPAPGQLGPRAELQLPGEAALVGRLGHRGGRGHEVAVGDRAEEARLRRRAPGGPDPPPRGFEGGGDGRAGGELGVEAAGELARDVVLDGPRRGDDVAHPGLEQPGDLRPRRAAVEEDQLQVAPLAQERRQPLGVGDCSPRAGRLEQEPVLARVAAVMEDRHPVAVLGEDVEDLVERGVGPDDQLAQALLLGRLQDRLELPQLPGQVAEVAMALLLVGEREDDHRQVGHGKAFSRAGLRKLPRHAVPVVLLAPLAVYQGHHGSGRGPELP